MDAVLPYIVDLKKDIDLLLSSYEGQKEKNLSLNIERVDLLEKISCLEHEIKELKERVDIVDMAKSIDVKGGDSASFARGRVNSLIRQIDKCVSLLNEWFMEKLNIKISLANRLYPMKVDVSEEKVIRLSAAKIEKIIKNLKDRYSVKDDQDLLAMCALQLCVRLEKSGVNKSLSKQKIIQDILDMKKDISSII